MTKAFGTVKKVHHIVILLLCIAVLAVSFLFELDQGQVSLFGFKCPLQCFLVKALDVKCALCGLTRSFCSLAHGQFLTSLKFHFLGPLLFAFLCCQIPYRIFAIVRSTNQINRKLAKANLFSGAILLTAVFANWLIYLGGRLL